MKIKKEIVGGGGARFRGGGGGVDWGGGVRLDMNEELKFL